MIYTLKYNSLGAMLLIYLLIAGILSGCMDFTISDEKAVKELASVERKPIFEDLMIGHQNIHFVHTGRSKETLAVFIHGSPGSWNAFIDFFKADSLLRQIDILAIDRPGFGRSGRGKAESLLRKQAYYMCEVVEKFPHSKKILIGHSLGGPLIARMALDYPKAFDGLVFVAASIDPEMEKYEWYRHAINTHIGSFLTPIDFEVSNDEILPLKRELEKMLPLWGQIKVPAIVIHGTEDSLVPVENVDFVKKMMPDSLLRIELLEHADHFIPWTHPGTIVRAALRLANIQ